jgi:hypothetical protein
VNSNSQTGQGSSSLKFKIAVGAAVTLAALGGAYMFIRQKFPIINDISTNLNEPPSFFATLEESGIDPVTMVYPAQFKEIQKAAYPFIVPFAIGGNPQSNFEKALAAATEKMNWKIVATDTEKLRFQALAITSLMKFKDDIVVTVEGNE